MKTTIKILFPCFACILTVFYILPCYASTEKKLKNIAVVNAKFDEIGKILNKYRISYKTCTYSDLENKELYNNFRTIFLPCGVDNPIETNVNILSRGTTIHSVSLKKNFHMINEEKIYKNIKSFIEDGGNAYFSDYSYKLLDGAFKTMDFYDNFPNMGITGEINLKLRNDLMFFSKTQDIKADMPHPGWIVVKSISNSETLAESTFNTIRDVKRSPIISLLKRSGGEIIYTSYHKTKGDDELERYIIYRLSFTYLLDRLLDEASFWEQNINCTIIDSIREWENYRSYIIPVAAENNTIYFLGESLFQIDIFDKDKRLIASKDSRAAQYSINIYSSSSQYLIIKIYPANPKTLGAYSIVSACGYRIIPYYKKALFGLFFIAIAAALYWINKIFGIKKFSGRIRQK